MMRWAAYRLLHNDNHLFVAVSSITDHTKHGDCHLVQYGEHGEGDENDEHAEHVGDVQLGGRVRLGLGTLQLRRAVGAAGPPPGNIVYKLIIYIPRTRALMGLCWRHLCSSVVGRSVSHWFVCIIITLQVCNVNYFHNFMRLE